MMLPVPSPYCVGFSQGGLLWKHHAQEGSSLHPNHDILSFSPLPPITTVAEMNENTPPLLCLT